METYIQNPKSIVPEIKGQLIDLIALGAQVDRHFVETGIPRALLIAMVVDHHTIACTATVKNPLDSYRKSVFENARATEYSNKYPLELGYIVTREEYEGKRLCQMLLSELMVKIATENIFATTRKPAMIHILKKFGFSAVGQVYKNDLHLLIYNGKKHD